MSGGADERGYPAGPDDRAVKIAVALRDALEAVSPDAFVQGDPKSRRGVIVDGRFDLLEVAERLLAFIDTDDQPR